MRRECTHKLPSTRKRPSCACAHACRSVTLLQEKLKELDDKFASELEGDRQKFEALLQEKNEQELSYEEKLKQVGAGAGACAPTDAARVHAFVLCMRAGCKEAALSGCLACGHLRHAALQAEARHGSQLAALDGQYQAKLMAEVERYQGLLLEKEALNVRWDEQNALLVEAHEHVVAELAEQGEARLAAQLLAGEALRQDKDALEREAVEVRAALASQPSPRAACMPLSAQLAAGR